jgi:hypothetical protein
MEERTLENTYPEGPEDTVELLAWIEREWVALMAPIRTLSEERLSAPSSGGWPIKDHIAHLSFWEQMLARAYLGGEPQNQVLGLTREEFERLDETAINALVQQRSKDRAAADIIAEAELGHGELVDAIARLPWDRLAQPVREGESTLLGWVVAGNTYGHYMEHGNWLQEMIRTE